MGGLNTVQADQEMSRSARPEKAQRRKGNSLLSRFMQDRHKRMSRMLGYALTLNNPDTWLAFGLVAAARLTFHERSALIMSLVHSLPERCAMETCFDAMHQFGDPSPSFLGGIEDARAWASTATRTELKAYTLACFEALPPADQAAFFRHISNVELAS